jgi:hypothetical protein
MNVKVKNRLKKALQEELVKRLLIKYFKEKSIDESPIYPPTVFDLPYRIPELLSAVEIVPFVESMDPMTNVVTIGWNLFVLGTNRMFLGTSTHTNLMEFRRSITGPVQNTNMPSNRKKTAAQVTEFIMTIVGRNKDALLELPPGANIPLFSQMMSPDRAKIGPSMSGSFYEKNRPVF